MNKSVWSDEVKLPKFEKLEGKNKTDVLIIGGGLCGLLCARFLQQKNVDYMLVEGKRIFEGVSKNTTAKITSQHGLFCSKLAKSFGNEQAAAYVTANEKALEIYRNMCKSIECDFEEKSSYVYSLDDRQKLEDEMAALNAIGAEAELVESTALPFSTKGAVRFDNQAQFNPSRFVAGFVDDLNIYENTFIKNIDNNVAASDEAEIKAGKIIVATHFPFIDRHGAYFVKLYQNRSYVLALENAQDVDGMYVDENDKGLSFRNYKGLLLLGGGSHRTGKHGGGWEELRRFRRNYYPQATEKYYWATQDCMSLDSMPYIGRYSKATPDMFAATGFNKWGMTSSMVSAMILSDMVMGIQNEYSTLFDPARSVLKPQLFINGFESVANILTPTAKRCSHLGCALKWNSAEHTWDCPCHGSRFDETGSVINNPATEATKVE